MDDGITPKSEPTDDEPLATPLPDSECVIGIRSDDAETTNGHVNDEFNKSFGSVQQNSSHSSGVTSSQYLTAQPNVTCISEKSWNAIVLNSEIIIHGSRNERDISTSGDTVVDSDVEIKPPTEEKEKKKENLNPEYDFIFNIAVISRTTPNRFKLIAISKIDTNIKVDIKSDGSSLNGYAADHSSSSTGSTVCGTIEEPFLIPKVPRDSFMSISSSSSSNGLLLQQSKIKPNDILLSKNVYTFPENLVCPKCDYVYPKISDNLSFDCDDIKNKSETKSRFGRPKQKKRPKPSNKNNGCCSRKKSKIINVTENLLKEDAGIKIEEELQDIDKPIDTVKNQIKELPLFEIGCKVFAYWVADKLFYPAVIIDTLHSKYKVEFLSDFVVKSVNVESLVHSAALKSGSPIAIFDTVSQEYRVGELVSINTVPNSEDTFTIDLESEVVVVPFEKLVLNQENAKMLQDKTVSKNYNRLSMSNISEGKRFRLTRSTNAKSGNGNVTKSSKRKKTKDESPQVHKKRKCLFPDESDPRCQPSTSTGITGENYELPPLPLVSEDSDFDLIREDLTTVNMHQLRNTDIDSENSSPDKVDCETITPNKSLEVFKDLHMVLSYAKYKRIPMCSDSDQSVDNELSLKSDYFKPDKLHKKHLETLISKNGGACHRYLNLVPRSRYKFTYLITDTPAQTCNFFLSLSLGIPSYHHKYIEQAISQKIPFPEFLSKNNIKPIPNGWAVETKKIVFRSPTIDRSTMFSGYIIYLALSEKSKNEFFAGLLRFCGAVVYTSWTNGITMPLTRHTTVIVTDEHCPSGLVHEKVPKLSVLWIVQSLICESPRPLNGHESYIAIDDE